MGRRRNKTSAKWVSLESRLSRVVVVGVIVAAALLLIHPVSSLVAFISYQRATSLVDDASTERIDLKPITRESLDDYGEAIRLLEFSERLAPNARKDYAFEAYRLQHKLARWKGLLKGLGDEPGGLVLDVEGAYADAERLLKMVIDSEPLNSDARIALARLYYERAGRPNFDEERALDLALKSYPINVPLRHRVAMHYLLSGREGAALEQARIIAETDDTFSRYKLSSRSDFSGNWLAVRRGALYRSYLFGALEIAWRVSHDPVVVRGILPGGDDAEDVFDIFVEWRGLDW